MLPRLPPPPEKRTKAVVAFHRSNSSHTPSSENTPRRPTLFWISRSSSRVPSQSPKDTITLLSLTSRQTYTCFQRLRTSSGTLLFISSKAARNASSEPGVSRRAVSVRIIETS